MNIFVNSLQLLKRLIKKITFRNSENYWIMRYKKGGTSGFGSYNDLAIFKSEVINTFIQKHKISTIIEFGCGDGNQVSLGRYDHYIGFDISPDAIDLCRIKFSGDPNKQFKLLKDYVDEKADLVLSLDVIYHLVEEKVFQNHLELLFTASNQFVIIYSSNTDSPAAENALHIKNRKFTDYIDAQFINWKLIDFIPNKYPDNGDPESSSFADFYIFQRENG